MAEDVVNSVPDIGSREPTMEDLVSALEWFLSESDTNRGVTRLPERGGRSWNEINEYWISNEDRAQAMIDAFRAKTAPSGMGISADRTTEAA